MDAIKKIEQILKGTYVDKVPEGYKTIDQICKEQKWCRSKTERFIKSIMQRLPKHIKTKEFMVQSGNTIRKIKHYYFS